MGIRPDKLPNEVKVREQEVASELLKAPITAVRKIIDVQKHDFLIS